jgi:hypothetical protein
VRLTRELPRWLSPRRIAALGAFVVVGVAGVLLWERHVRNEIFDKLAESSEASASVRSVLVRGWADARLSDARLLASVLGSRPAAGGVLEPDSVLLASIIATGHFDSAWILNASGGVVGGVRTNQAPT